MTETRNYRVLHPTDITTGSLPAFAHGLLIATKAEGQFTVLHVEGDNEVHWSEMPGVRELLARWKMIQGPEDKEGLEALGLGVKKIIASGDDAAATTINYLDDHPMELVVLGTHQDKGWHRWTRTQVAEPIARSAHTHSLFIPTNARGFVDLETGKAHLKKVLIPIAASPRPDAAIEATKKLTQTLGLENLQCTLLHIGEAGSEPITALHYPDNWQVDHATMLGDVVDSIVAKAKALDVDMVVMTTKGHDGFLDMLRGSRTEQVLRQASFAVLAVPEK